MTDYEFTQFTPLKNTVMDATTLINLRNMPVDEEAVDRAYDMFLEVTMSCNHQERVAWATYFELKAFELQDAVRFEAATRLVNVLRGR